MVLAVFITWPVVVVGGAKSNNIHYVISVDDSGDSVNTTSMAILDHDTFGNENSMDTGPFAQPIEDVEQDRSMRLELSNVVHQPLKRKERVHQKRSGIHAHEEDENMLN
jgi:hypothetical protein